ncbi:hypothetical protein [Leptospira sarikeiensis]|uniref:Uncharacterized protein n=1 Tax=Leptospira sarikeiensis TaxID=2484943 RepID=A0A4R9K2A0_9LEPT|nr:hypothetical protein [Leptospira sarikeiensis]TGL58974.1 hypothetical protein EHQ64_18230 [Leptospira sarikeiensis]
MKRLWLLPLILFLVVALFSEVVARDYTNAKSYTFQKKSRTLSFRDGDDQGLPSLISAGGDDANVGTTVRFSHSESGIGNRFFPHISDRSISFHSLAYRYLFLPPPV